MNNIVVHVLKTSRRLQAFEDKIKSEALGTIKDVCKLLPVSNIDIVVSDNPSGAIPHIGIGGYAPNAHLIYISIDPSFKPLSTPIKELKGTLSHELHHCLRWTNPGYGATLLEAIITEGLADYFELQITKKPPQRWSVALDKNELNKWLSNAKAEFNNKQYDHNEWFYGSKRIPKWTGYSLGYYLVGEYLKKHPGESAETLYSTPASEFLI